MDIKNISPVGKTPYYALYKNGKYARYIGNAAKLQAFQRDAQIGEDTVKILAEQYGVGQNPGTNPR